MRKDHIRLLASEYSQDKDAQFTPCWECSSAMNCRYYKECLHEQPVESPPPAAPIVELPYQTPAQRTLTTARREAIQAGILVALTLGGDLIAQALTDTSLGDRTVALMIAGILIKALITVATKWDRATTEG